MSNSVQGRDLQKPALILANRYQSNVKLDDYWVSEKLDGVRAYWNGKHLVSRGGNIYHAPRWFSAHFPAQKLDGELWIARQRFELLVATVRDNKPDDKAWRKVKFMVFDMPDLDMTFNQRLLRLRKIVSASNVPWLKLVKQWKVTSRQDLMTQLKFATDAGAEGLMLHKGASFYNGKRSNDLLKLKPFDDAEARVIAYMPGKGKYRGLMGALIVETEDGIHFKIGTGFSDNERKNPPPIGTQITYRYQGKTINGVPRFASFLRIRPYDK